MTRSTRLLSRAAAGEHRYVARCAARGSFPMAPVTRRMAAVVATSDGFNVLPAPARRASGYLGSSALRSTAITAASSLLRPLLTSRRLSPTRSPRVRCQNFRNAPPGSTGCTTVTVGLRISQHARRPQPASLPVRVPAVVPSLRASSRLASRRPPCVSLRLSSLSRLPPLR